MKKLTTGELNLMKKYNITDVEAPATEVAVNPWSGVRVNLNKAAKDIYNTIIYICSWITTVVSKSM